MFRARTPGAWTFEAIIATHADAPVLPALHPAMALVYKQKVE